MQMALIVEDLRGDMADQAGAVVELSITLAMQRARHAAAQPTSVSEACLNCGERTTSGARWCDAECRDDWSRRQGARA